MRVYIFIALCVVVHLNLVRSLSLNNQEKSTNHQLKTKTIDLDDRKSIWEWLDRINNERAAQRNASQQHIPISFALPSKNETLERQTRLKTQVEGLKKSVATQMAEDNAIAKAMVKQGKNNTKEEKPIVVEIVTQPILNDEKVSTELKTKRTKTKTESQLQSLVKPIPEHQTSSSPTSVLQFKSKRTNIIEHATISIRPATLSERAIHHHHKRTSSVLNLPPVPAEWTFTCPPGKTGYFADSGNECRVYYVCSSDRGERQRFLCPLGTRFNQEQSNCDWWDKVSCHEKTTDERKRV
ncbi:hypothetical protein RDWZM_000302 [Blomia tropicalis]|uniref:Chitin-binding type-2 domain-containing protein n=1 Tax=Blomia tropicalis TaxID=40697 RepID=A0A9Q0MC50_BLOTA|nr:hypothetical protein RDWZM_000302 [Blomia tropicalis]